MVLETTALPTELYPYTAANDFKTDSHKMAEKMGFTQMLRICRSAPPLTVGLNISLFESPPDFLSALKPFRLRIPLHLYGGEDGIRTHAALANPNDLANRPLQPLEYFSRLK